MRFKTLLQGFGAAILFMLLPIWSQLSPHHQALYHSFLPMQTLIRGTLLDLTVATMLATLLFWYLEKHGDGWANLIWGLVAAILAPAAIADIAALLHVRFTQPYSKLLFYGVLLAAVGLRWLRPGLYRWTVRGLQRGLLLAGCSVFWMVPEMLYLGFRAQRSDTPVPILRAGLAPAREDAEHNGRRTVWLIFDELSYDQTFDHRFPGLALPNFDRLKQESVSFANLQPAGPDTERVVPSLLLGRKIEALHSDLDGNPSIRLAGQSAWQRFDPQLTIFSDAQRLGWTTGIVGWYNPYCRILAATLDYCFWRMGNGQWEGTAPEKSSLQNALVPSLRVLYSWQGKPGFVAEKKHASDLAVLTEQATALIRDQRISFILIHLSVPHPPGIYDRRSARLSSAGSYIDNLALADRVLGQLRETIDATPLAANTSIVVSSDHSWRVPLWRPTGFWTKEDEIASQGRFDPRPVLMIHSPGQRSGQDVTAPFDALRIHDILETLLRGKELRF